MLQTILAHKRGEIEAARAAVPVRVLESRARERGAVRSLAGALAGREGPAHRLVAEIKRASPSRGVLRQDLEVGEVAAGYVRAGAVAISVLTDERFFHGSPAHLERVRDLVEVPVLRKDFLLDPYQLHEARAWGADAVLLIVRALEADALPRLLQCSRDLGLEALVEVHDESDLGRALDLGVGLLAINNRDLDSFRVDLSVTERLMRSVPPGVLTVSASGLRVRADLDRLEAAGVTGFLVGEALMTAPDPERKLRELAW